MGVVWSRRRRFSLSGNDDIATLNGYTSLNVAPVPEPGSLVLLGAGLLGAGTVAWRRRPRA